MLDGSQQKQKKFTERMCVCVYLCVHVYVW